jgi:plastocyanin
MAYQSTMRDEIEKSPAIHLACRPEFRLAELAQNIKPPEDVLLLTESGGQWVHVGGRLPSAKNGDTPAAPEPFARCEVRNYGRLPVLDIRLPLHVTFFTANVREGKPAQADVDIPGLSADGSYEFSMMNGTAQNLTYAFDRTIELTRVDRRSASPANLFADRRLADLEARPVRGTVAEAAAPAAPLTIVIKSFKFKPAQLQIKAGQTVTFVNADDEAHALVTADKSFASGAIDPRASWRHTFTKAGRYALHCDYHPYMQAAIVVD